MPINKYIIIVFAGVLLVGSILQILYKKELLNDFLLLNWLNNEQSNARIIKVRISGCVKQPGQYTLKYGDRLKDLIDKANGLLPYAEQKLVFSRVLVDGEEYDIPYRKLNIGEKIDINNAQIHDLFMLPYISTNVAKRIMEYRNKKGKITSIHILTNVSGIGIKRIEVLKNFVIIGE